MKTNRTILCAAAAVALAATACTKLGTRTESDVLKEGDAVPEFTAVMNDGTVVRGSDLLEGESYVVFFNTSCPDCRRELPRLQREYDSYGNSVRFVLISREEEALYIERFWRDNNLTMPYSPQTDREIYNLFANEYIPRLYVIKDGIIEKSYCETGFPF